MCKTKNFFQLFYLVTLTNILRPRIDRFLVYTRWPKNKIFKKPLFDKKWNLGRILVGAWSDIVVFRFRLFTLVTRLGLYLIYPVLTPLALNFISPEFRV